MDHKSWLWRKRSSEKTIVVNSETIHAGTNGHDGEACEKDKADELEKIVEDLNEKLSNALSESKSKDHIIQKHAKVAEDATTGWEKAESEAMSYKHELDNALQRATDAEERANQLDGALKECMKQLRHIREEQERRIHDAISKVTRDYEREKIKLEDKLAEANKVAVELRAERNQLSKIIQVKEKVMEDIKERNLQAETNFNALSMRLNSSGKMNSTLKYELCMLEKELEIRNEEKEYNRRAADASQKQLLESVKKIAELESECQKLKLLIRKRLPGPAAVARMKNEVGTLGKDPGEHRRKRVNHAKGAVGASNQETMNKRFVFLTERMSAMEEETEGLKEALAKKNHELQSSKILRSRTMSKLSQVEAQILQLMRGQDGLLPTKSGSASVVSISEDGGNDYENSSSESWASALISDLEQFKSKKPNKSCTSFGTSDLRLMDDFLEMEQLALVSVDKPSDNLNTIVKEENLRIDSSAKTVVAATELNGKELVPSSDNDVNCRPDHNEKSPDWLLNLIKGVLLDHVIERNAVEILESIRVALNDSSYSLPIEIVEVRTPSNPSENLGPSCTKSCLSSRSPPPISPRTDSSSRLHKSISKVINIVEGAMESLNIYAGTQQNDTGYTVSVVQWKNSEVDEVLLGFIEACNNILQDEIGIEEFATKLYSTLDWIVNHFFSLQDVSNTKDRIKKRLEYEAPLGEIESKIREMDTASSHPQSTVSEKNPKENHVSESDISVFQDDQDGDHLKRENKPKNPEQISKPNEESDTDKPEKQNAEDGMNLVITNHSDSIKEQIHQSDQQVSSVELELEGAVENHKLLNENLEKKLSAVNDELTDACKKLPSLKVELEEKTICVETLEARCVELQLQLESAKKRETSSGIEETDRRLRNDLEISVASEKLAECQETILNLGKQLKALASPKDAAVPSNVVPLRNRRLSLLDQMLIDDGSETGSPNSPKIKEAIPTTVPEQKLEDCHPKTNLLPANTSQNGLLYGWKLVDSDHDGTTSEALYQRTPVKTPENYFEFVEKQKPESGESRPSDTSPNIVPRINAKGGGGGGGFLSKLLTRERRETKKSLGGI